MADQITINKPDPELSISVHQDTLFSSFIDYSATKSHLQRLYIPPSGTVPINLIEIRRENAIVHEESKTDNIPIVFDREISEHEIFETMVDAEIVVKLVPKKRITMDFKFKKPKKGELPIVKPQDL